MTSKVSSGPDVHIDNCESEPIHIPGAVQPHGVLLAMREADLRVEHVSDNSHALLGVAPAKILGAPADQVLDAGFVQLLRTNFHARSWARFNPISTIVNARTFDAIVHRLNEWLIVELEPTSLVLQGSYRDYGADTHQAMIRLHGAESFGDLLQNAADVVRWVTGYDRVMIYRFDDDGHGQIVAEDRVQSLEPFLGLHYPASDIPPQARRLYLLNWLRVIGDIDYKRAKLLTTPALKDAPPLDLTYSTLRSVSPIHIEYLRNMGVRASMSVSLVDNGKLWGLIACHHYSPKFVPYSVRMTCELLGRMLSTLIASWQSREDAHKQERISEHKVRILENLQRAEDIASGLKASEVDLLAVFHASSAAVLEDGRCVRMGPAPSDDKVRVFARWMAEAQHEVIAFHTPEAFADAPTFGPEWPGVLALGLPESKNNIVLLFRPEIERTVAWAGNPEKDLCGRTQWSTFKPARLVCVVEANGEEPERTLVDD